MFQEGALAAAVEIAVEEPPASHRGLAQGVLGVANSVGSGLAAFLRAFIELFPGGGGGLCAVSVLPLLFVPFLRRTIPESRRWTGRAHPRPRFVPAAYRGRLLAGLAVFFLGMSYDVAGFAFTAFWPMSRHGWSAARTSALIIVAGGIGLPGFWVGGRLTDRMGRRRSAALLLVGPALAEAAFFLGGSGGLLPRFTATGFFPSRQTTPLPSWAPRRFPT